MEKVYRKLVAHLLEMASDEFSNHGCNELDLKAFVPDVEDRRALMKELEAWNNSPDEYDPKAKYEDSDDWLLMRFFADKIRKSP